MYNLLAIAPRDGWAFVRQPDGSVLLIRPPFRETFRTPATQQNVDAAISQHGFEPSTEQFPTKAGLIVFLKREIVESARRENAAIPEDAAEIILRHAPESTVDRLLLRVENELLPTRRFEHAHSVLCALMYADKVVIDTQRQKKVQELFGRAKRGLPIPRRPPTTEQSLLNSISIIVADNRGALQFT
ncbi:MAG: hypothetical protein R2729_31315 [Bryobacteraceae bacterium]